eukprot:TRINITY_DN4189_c0_g1_i2.p1 TRINITY_DN4189_c0_g1~~TRINITY_DN4189_c0_g1_i2.p1  ORF type:complete len:126 (+),score=9.40 TRINITY_DN4189_c0_g1_i2:93-470(+)
MQDALLYRHKRHRVHGASYPGVIPCEEELSFVDGSVLFGLSKEEIGILDSYEDVEYVRKTLLVWLRNATGEPTQQIEAEVWLWSKVCNLDFCLFMLSHAGFGIFRFTRRRLVSRRILYKTFIPLS